MISESDSLFLQLLRWVREDDGDFDRGYTYGYMNASQHKLAPWQYTYIRNVQRQFLRGETA